MTKTGAPMVVHMEKGESVAEAAQKQANLDSKVFDSVWIPVYVAKPVADPLNPQAATASATTGAAP
jgi:hypothetical protein